MFITGKQNETVKEFARLKDARIRRERQMFIAEGEHLTQEAISQKAHLYLFVQDDQKEKYAALIEGSQLDDRHIFILPASLFAKLCDTKTPQGIATVCAMPPAPKDLGKSLVALNAVQDPGNVGSILRTMDAADFSCLILDRHCADPFSQKAIRASMGAVFRIPTVKCEELSDILPLGGADILAASLDGENFYQKHFNHNHFCILIGNEGSGLQEHVKNLANSLVKLPMPGGAESLNAACALSIIAYDIIRRKQTEENK